jgi:hypothetical protein
MNKIILSLFFILFSNLTYSQFWLDSLDLSPIYAPNSITCDNDNVVEWDDYEVMIFNCWGECIWYSKDIEEWWIGDKVKSGTHFSKDGLYTYKIQARKGFETTVKEGVIYVIR